MLAVGTGAKTGRRLNERKVKIEEVIMKRQQELVQKRDKTQRNKVEKQVKAAIANGDVLNDSLFQSLDSLQKSKLHDIVRKILL